MTIEASYLGNTVMPVVMDAYEGAALEGIHVADKETLVQALHEYTMDPEVVRYVTSMSDQEVKDFLNTFIRVSHRIAQAFPPEYPPGPEGQPGWYRPETPYETPIIGSSPTTQVPEGFGPEQAGWMIYDPETGEYRDYREGDVLKHGDYRVLEYDDPNYGTMPIIQQLTGVDDAEGWSPPMAISYTPEGQEEQLIVPPAPEDIGTMFMGEAMPLQAPGPTEMGRPYPGYEVPEFAFPSDYPIFKGPEYPGEPPKAPVDVAEVPAEVEEPALVSIPEPELATEFGGLTYPVYQGPRVPADIPPEIAGLDIGEAIPAGVQEIPGAPGETTPVPPAPAAGVEVGVEMPTAVEVMEEAPPAPVTEFAPPEEAAPPETYVPEPMELPPSLQYEPPDIPGVREAPSPPPPPEGSWVYEPPAEPPAEAPGVLRMQPGAQDPYQEAEPFWYDAPPEIQKEYEQPPPQAAPQPVAPAPQTSPVRIRPGAEPGGAMWEEPVVPAVPPPELPPVEPTPYSEMPQPEFQPISPAGPMSTPQGPVEPEMPIEYEMEFQGSMEEIMRQADNTEQPALRPTKNVEFGTGTRVETTQGKVVKNRGGGSYSIPKGSNGEIIQDIFGDGTRFRVRIDDGGVADYNRGEIGKAATISDLLQEVERLASHGADTGDVIFHLLRRRASNEAIQVVLDNAEQLGIL